MNKVIGVCVGLSDRQDLHMLLLGDIDIDSGSLDYPFSHTSFLLEVEKARNDSTLKSYILYGGKKIMLLLGATTFIKVNCLICFPERF